MYIPLSHYLNKKKVNDMFLIIIKIIYMMDGIVQRKAHKRFFCLSSLFDIMVSRRFRGQAFDRVLAQRARVGRVLQRLCQGLVMAVHVELGKDL